MVTFEPRGTTYAATVRGVDVSKPLSDDVFAELLRGLGKYGLLCFPREQISPAQLAAFSARFGELHQSSVNAHCVPEVPAVTILSNIMKDGKAIGIQDAGQEWHTDMSYNRMLEFMNVLLARKVPMRDGKPLGATLFADTKTAYDDLPADIKTKLANATATHFLGKYWDYVRTVKGSKRAPLTEQQLREKPPVSHPVFLTHPISGHKILFVNPSFTVKIDGMDEAESDRTLQYLFDHILKDKYRYVHEWSEGDLIAWDLISSWHNAVPDYKPDEPRLIERCQVLGNRLDDPGFVSAGRLVH